jgi:parallel beta-helix repeat protein
MERRAIAAFGFCGLVLVAAWGPLDPPDGPITSTYKTLTEVEPRIAVNATNTPGDASSLFKISKPGSYYLTGNLTGVAGKTGITINTTRVMLDLNGFVLEGGDVGTTGVLVVGFTGVTVRNGVVDNWAGPGLDASNTRNGRFDGITALNNSGYGIILGQSCIATACFSHKDSGGFSVVQGGVLTDCSVFDAITGVGYSCGPNVRLVNCSSESAATDGFRCGPGATLANCSAIGSFGDGFVLQGPASVTGCTARENGDSGFVVEESATVSDCTAQDNDLYGFQGIARSRFTRCTARENLTGFHMTEGNSVVECTSAANTSTGVSTHGNANTVERSTLHENGLYGLRVASGVGNNIDGNLATYNGQYGLLVQSTDNLLVRNRARGNSDGNYFFSVITDYGVILTNPGQGFTSSAAWANFEY